VNNYSLSADKEFKMIIGVPKETKTDEYRVALLPVGAQLLCRDGHTVLIEQEAGLDSGFDDEQYSTVGAQILKTAEEVYSQAELIVQGQGTSASGDCHP
jgi:alanine dehydrogenase